MAKTNKDIAAARAASIAKTIETVMHDALEIATDKGRQEIISHMGEIAADPEEKIYLSELVSAAIAEYGGSVDKAPWVVDLAKFCCERALREAARTINWR